MRALLLAPASAAAMPRRWTARLGPRGRVVAASTADMCKWSRRSAAVHPFRQVEAQAHRRRPARVGDEFWRCCRVNRAAKEFAQRMEVCAVVLPDNKLRQYQNTGREVWR